MTANFRFRGTFKAAFPKPWRVAFSLNLSSTGFDLKPLMEFLLISMVTHLSHDERDKIPVAPAFLHI